MVWINVLTVRLNLKPDGFYFVVPPKQFIFLGLKDCCNESSRDSFGLILPSLCITVPTQILQYQPS
jgi:hypothetical protein